MDSDEASVLVWTLYWCGLCIDVDFAFVGAFRLGQHGDPEQLGHSDQ